MGWSDQIRGWRGAGLCGLLGLAVHGFAIAQTQTETSPVATKSVVAPPAATKSAPASATTGATTKHPTSAQAASKHASSHRSSHTSAGTSSHTPSHTSAQKSKNVHGKTVAKKRGQQAIDSTRARQIQTALIREHYMQGEPTGTWDGATQAAMQKYQADQGWQSKQIPDSRALIRLGLGPSSDHLLNPESAMTAGAASGGPKASTKQTPAENNLPQQ